MSNVKYLSYEGLSHFKNKLDDIYIKKTGGVLTGTLTTRGILPSSNNAYNIGSADYKYNTIHATTFAGNASSATQLTTSAGDWCTPVYFGNGKPVASTKINENLLTKVESPNNSNLYNLNPIELASSSVHSANRMQFANPAGIIVEYSTDGGATWIDYSLSNDEKVNLVSGISQPCYAGKSVSSKASANDKLRITINASECGFYTQATALLFNFSTNGAENCKVDVEIAMRGSETNFSTWKTELGVSGWSGWNAFRFGGGSSFGGGESQTTNLGAVRLSFYSSGVPTSSTYKGHFWVSNIQLLGNTYWTNPSTMAKTGHLYDYNYLQDMILPHDLIPATHNTGGIGWTTKQWGVICARDFYENGVLLSNKYATSSHTHSFLTGTGVASSATTRDLTNFPATKTLFTGYWGSSKGYATNYGTTLDISYSTWYQRLAFNTDGRIEYFRGINSNNSDNTSATLAKVGDLAYTSDIPTKVSQLTNDAGYTTANGHTHNSVTTSTAGFMSAADKSKLDGIASGANNYTHPSSHPASMITGLATVATSGSYNDLTNKPTIDTHTAISNPEIDTIFANAGF